MSDTTAGPSPNAHLAVSAINNEPLPSLNYSIRGHKRRMTSIFVFFALFLAEAGFLPLILFYALKWSAHLSLRINLAIITSFVGTYSGFKFARRQWWLWFSKGSAENRPLGAGRWGIDCCQIWMSIGMTFFFIPLIIGSSLTPASAPTVAMALPLLMLSFCVPLLVTGLFPHKIRLPLRISSFPPYVPLPPLTYTLLEDVVAVDGGGHLAFRTALAKRYEHSIRFRKLMRDTAIFWGLTGCVCAAAFIAVAWTTTDDIGYGISYGLPWLWAMIASAITVWWVDKELIKEREEWIYNPSDGKPEQIEAELILKPVMSQVEEV